MKRKIQVHVGKDSEGQGMKREDSVDVGPFIRFQRKRDEETGADRLVGIGFSDGTEVDCKEALKKYKAALKKATGTDNTDLGEQIFLHIALGLATCPQSPGLDRLLTLLPGLRPQDENEAMILGQFIALQESGFRCLRNAIEMQSCESKERFSSLATKLLRTANETMQTLVKYRTMGRQEIQIVHLHNEGQAIVTQNLSNGGGGNEKSTN